MGGDDRVSGRVKFPERFDPDDPLADNYERKKRNQNSCGFHYSHFIVQYNPSIDNIDNNNNNNNNRTF